MKIKEITEQATEAEPTIQDIAAVKQMVNDLPKEQPQTALSKFTSFMDRYPVVDVLTDFIPQTRLVKALLNTASSLEQGDKSAALASISTALTGSVGKAVDVGQRVQGVAQAVNAYNQTGATQTALAPKTVPTDELEPIKEIQHLAGLK